MRDRGRRGSKPSVSIGSPTSVSIGAPSPPAPAAAPPQWQTQMEVLTTQLGQLLEEVRALRKENSELRRQVEAARGLQQHQPYALSPLVPLPQPQFSPMGACTTARTRTAGELTPEAAGLVPSGEDGMDVAMPSPPADVESKRARRSLELELGNAVAGASADSGAPLGHAE